MKDYRMVPAWLIVKTEILSSLYTANDLRATYTNQPTLNNLRNFTNQVLHLHQLLRTKIRYLKNSPEHEKYKTMSNRLDALTTNPNNPTPKEWQNIYTTLQELTEDLGVTMIEIPVDRTRPPEEAWKEGLPVDIE